LEIPMSVAHDVIDERAPATFEGRKIAWGGVFGGVLSGIGVLMLLSSLGLAVGISAVDPRDADASAIGTGAAIWTGLTLLVALFVGGWASTYLSMLWERTTAMFEGMLVWVLSLILILYLAASGIGLIASGAFGMLGNAAQAVVKSLDYNQLSSGNVEQISARLRDPQTANMIASALQLPTDQVTAALTTISSRVDAARDNPAQAATEVRNGLANLATRAKQNLSETAARAKPQASATAWLSFAALLLSLFAAIGGAAVGRRGVARRVSA
jgi:hypothetical protein